MDNAFWLFRLFKNEGKNRDGGVYISLKVRMVSLQSDNRR